MNEDKTDLQVIHITEKNRFEIHVDDKVAELDYRVRDNVITFTHTGVPRELEGRGIGSRIVRAGLDYARAQAYQIVPLCSFVDAYMRHHPEYEDFRAAER